MLFKQLLIFYIIIMSKDNSLLEEKHCTHDPQHEDIFFLGSAAPKESNDQDNCTQDDDPNGRSLMFLRKEFNVLVEEYLGNYSGDDQYQPRQLKKQIQYIY